ncbi:sine oculis-binding protein homolog A isoform X4 [Venturia canescens]|uniref:sine oculis-binding protein homolog A isoform X4 n=1 Tax=Venturia canescens TaxID=32260 RepID=UPI001C9D2156|nr:sine oculis-binding protein homolog A isoform X4 [Venturia canescens]
MSSKPSLPNLRGNTARKSTAAIQLGSSSSENTDKSVAVPKIKKEVPEDEIKEYAATAMSELLGWYGYEKVDSGCTRGLNLDHFGKTVNSRRHSAHNRRREIITPLNVNDAATTSSTSPNDRSKGSLRSPISCRASRSSPTAGSLGSTKDNGSLGGGHRPSSRSSSLQTGPGSPRVLDNSDSASDTADGATNCSWCGRASGTWEPGNGSLSFTLTGENSGRFCSEACFAAGRRAAFKRARTCDWCKHVRHSVSYVDFQDGESQLQFCSDKCLNQYKMNIFCRETQAHLGLHNVPTLPWSSSNPSTCAAGLITPELWLRDCRSPPPSPDEENVIVDGDEDDGDEEDEGEIGKIEKTRSSIQAVQGCPIGEPRILTSGLSSLDRSIHESKFGSITPKMLEESEEKKEAEAHDERLRFEMNEAIKESLLEEEHRCRALKLEQTSRNSSHEPTRSSDLPEIDNPSISPLNNDSIVEQVEKRKETVLLLKDVNKLLASNPTRGHPKQRRISRSPPWHPPEHLRPSSSINSTDTRQTGKTLHPRGQRILEHCQRTYRNVVTKLKSMT